MTEHRLRAGRRGKRLLIGAATGVLGVPIFAILHNVFDALSLMADHHALLSRFLGGLDVACFMLAVVACPAAAAICLIWAVIDRQMARGARRTRRILLIVVPVTAAVVVAVVLFGKSLNLSTRKVDRTAGYNGSFEIVKSGYPANWFVYHRPLDSGDSEMSTDTDAVDGARSLKFVVHKVNPAGGWRNPGLFQVSDAEEGRSYRISLWLKNRGAKVRLGITSEAGESREPRTPISEIIDADKSGDDTWRQFAYTYIVPAHYANIRFELDFVEPGTVWIDDVRVEPM